MIRLESTNTPRWGGSCNYICERMTCGAAATWILAYDAQEERDNFLPKVDRSAASEFACDAHRSELEARIPKTEIQEMMPSPVKVGDRVKLKASGVIAKVIKIEGRAVQLIINGHKSDLMTIDYLKEFIDKWH